MKHLLVALVILLGSLPAVSQVAPLRPRYPQLDTVAYDNARTWIRRADSLLNVRALRIQSLKREVTILTEQVQNRTAEVDRERAVSTQLRVDKQVLQQRVDKALALPLRPPLLLDGRTYVVGGVVGLLVGLFAPK